MNSSRLQLRAEFLQLLADVLKQRGEEVNVLRENARLVSAPIRLGEFGKRHVNILDNPGDHV